MGLSPPAEAFALRTDDHLAYGRLIVEGAGIGFVTRCNVAAWPASCASRRC